MHIKTFIPVKLCTEHLAYYAPLIMGEWDPGADLPGWHGVATATLKIGLATPAATPVGSFVLKEKLWLIGHL